MELHVVTQVRKGLQHGKQYNIRKINLQDSLVPMYDFVLFGKEPLS